MSYDLNLFTPSPGLPIEEAAEKWLHEEEKAALRGTELPADPAKEELKRKLSDELTKKNPRLISSSEDSMFRAIVLDGPPDGNGIQISIFDDSVGIRFPYWHTGKQAERVLREVWEYLEILERIGNFRTYDPQLGRVLNLRNDSDFQEALSKLTIRWMSWRACQAQKGLWQNLGGSYGRKTQVTLSTRRRHIHELIQSFEGLF
jgi:hypothetical protein